MAEYAPPLILTGLAEVIASGTVIAFDRYSISISVALDPHDPFPPPPSLSVSNPAFRSASPRPPDRLNIHFQFRDDLSDSTGPPRTEFGGETTREIKLVLINFNDPYGTGNKEPLKLGTLGTKSLYLSYRVYALAESPKMLHYTVYLRDDARVTEIQREALLKAMKRDG